jgi:hypothetical protein
VHPTGGSLRVLKQFSRLRVGSGKEVLPRPTHQRVTQAVGRVPDWTIKHYMNEHYMNSEQAPFPTGWYTAGHGKLWNCDQTYCLVPYSSLPLLEQELFRDEFQWLTGLENELQNTMENERGRTTENLDSLIYAAKQVNLRLPHDFIKFMRTPHLQNQIPSCTGCYFDLSDRLITCPNKEDGYLIRFLNDQQTVLMWYLYINQQNDCGVVVALPRLLDNAISESFDDVFVPQEILFCAPSFEEFLYRFWIENKIWFYMREGWPLTNEQQKYLNARRL